MKKINTQKFIQFLNEMNQKLKALEADAMDKKDYVTAHEYKVERETFEWLRLTITGEQGTDLGEFMEEE